MAHPTEWKLLYVSVAMSCANSPVMFSSPGDIMGTAMQNMHQLLLMPFGNGEQNMVLFAPNIYVLDYLDKTRQLSEDVKSKTVGYLVSGESFVHLLTMCAELLLGPSEQKQ